MNLLIPHRITLDSHPILLDRMRELYNSNIPFLATKPLTYLDRAAQMKWWANLDRSKNIIHVYSPVEEPWDICAFSKVTDHDTHCSPLFAIGGKWWGRGYGREIIAHYIKLSGKPLHGAQLTSNKAICHLNEKFGWQVVSTEDGVDTLFHPGPAPQRQQEIYNEILRYSEET